MIPASLIETRAANISMFSSFGLVEGPAVGKLQASFAEIVQRLSQQLEDTAIQAASAPTAKDFQILRERLLPTFVNLYVALSSVVLADLDLTELPDMVRACFTALEALFEEKAHSYFGDDAYQEIIFSVSTLKSAYRWALKIETTAVEPALTQKDEELRNGFAGASLWSNFHLIALVSALRKNLTLAPEVLQELLDGLRQSVVAFSCVRQAADLRNILDSRYVEEPSASWDDEDEALANAD